MVAEATQLVFFVLTGALLMGVGAPLYKKCTERVGKITFDKFMRDPWGLISKIVFNRIFFVAVVCGTVGFILYIRGLSFGEATVAGPLLAGMYVSSLIVSVTYLKERLTRIEVIGIFTVIFGIVVMALAGGAFII